jgi:hypothetical protein
MTATVGAGPQAALVAPSTPPQPPSEDPERQRQLLQALTTEHFTLQTARSATIADSNGRSALYLATVSSAVVALAFIGQITHLGQAFHLFTLALLPALMLLGILTYLRLVQTAVEDLFYARAINRIRRHYVDLDPEAAPRFLLCGFDDPAGVLAAMGLAALGATHSRGHLLSHAATMVAVVTSIIGGVGAALTANAVGGGRLPVAVSASLGVLVAAAATAAFGWHQVRRWRAAEASVPSLFPSQPGQAGTADLHRPGTDTSQADS